MKEILTIHKDGQRCYDILYSGDLADLKEALLKLSAEGKRFCIIADSNTGPLYGDKIASLMEPAIPVYEIPAGEKHKNLDEIRKIYTYLVTEHFDRSTCLIALGGGVE